MNLRFFLVLFITVYSSSVYSIETNEVFSTVIERLSKNNVMGPEECKTLLEPDEVILGEYKMDSGETAFLVASQPEIRLQEMIHDFGELKMVINGKRYRVVQPHFEEDRHICAQNSKFKYSYNSFVDREIFEKVVCYEKGKASFCKNDRVISHFVCSKNPY